MTQKSNGRRKASSSRPEGYLAAGHKVPLHLTKQQQAYCKRSVGIARMVFNLCVSTHNFCRTNRLNWPSWQDLQKSINQWKNEQNSEIAFLTEVSKFVTEGAVKDFGKAIDNWTNPKIKARRPTTKRKRLTGSGSFLAASGVDTIHYGGKRRIKLPCLGSVKLDATLPKGIFYEAHISFTNGQWFLSLNYWKPPVPKPAPETDTRIPEGAVDPGVTPHATDSEGQTWENPKALYKAERKLRRLQRAQARRKTGSRRWWQAQHKIDNLYQRINGLRNNAVHQMTSELTHKFQHLVIEDLHVAGLMKGKTPKALADASMGEIKRQLSYKGDWRHCQITLAPRFYPSSKTCSLCQYVNSKLKRERYWQCPNCNTYHERNLNAAVNLRQLLTLPAGSGATLRRQAMPGNGKALAQGPPPRRTKGETGPDERRTAPLSQRATQTVDGKKVRPSARLPQSTCPQRDGGVHSQPPSATKEPTYSSQPRPSNTG